MKIRILTNKLGWFYLQQLKANLFLFNLLEGKRAYVHQNMYRLMYKYNTKSFADAGMVRPTFKINLFQGGLYRNPTMYQNVKLDIIGKADHISIWQQQPVHGTLWDH